MPRKEFIDIVKEIRTTGQAKKMTIRSFLWLFNYYEKRTSGNVWHINDYLRREKLIVEPNYQIGWIDQEIQLKGKDKAKISNNKESSEKFDPINRLSVLDAAAKIPHSIKRDATLEKAYHIMWHNDFSQLPVMNDDRTVLGIVTWQTIAKGLIGKKNSNCVKDFMSDNFTVLNEDTPLFDAIKEVIRVGVVFVRDGEKKIKGPVTTADLNKEFIEQIEPFILLEQIENYIRLILHDKIVLEDIHKLIKVDDGRKVSSISDMNFGEYIRVVENPEMWTLLKLPFDREDFRDTLNNIRTIRNGVMHFHPDKIYNKDLNFLRNTSRFLQDFHTCTSEN